MCSLTRIALTGLVLVAAAGPVRAQDDPPPLTIQVAVDEALRRNPDLLALQQQFEAARERPSQERFLAPPTFEAQIWQWPINTLNPTGTGMYMFTVGQELPGLRKRALRETFANAGVAVVEASIAVQANDILNDVKEAYAELFLARKAIEVHHATHDLLRQLADVAQARYAVGGISQHDVLTAVLELSRIEEHLIGLDERAGLAEAQLNTLLDRRPDVPIGPVAEPSERRLLAPAETLQALAVDRQPELVRAKREVDRTRAYVDVVSSEYSPDFFVRGGYMLMPSDRDGWTVSAGLTWPRAPWSRGRLDAQRAEATAQVSAVEARIRAIENGVRLRVQNAYVRAQAAQRRATLLRTTVLPQADQALDVSRIAYQADRAAFLAMIDTQRVRLDAQLAYYDALSDFDQALAHLERAVGTELPSAALGIEPAAEAISKAGARHELH